MSTEGEECSAAETELPLEEAEAEPPAEIGEIDDANAPAQPPAGYNPPVPDYTPQAPQIPAFYIPAPPVQQQYSPPVYPQAYEAQPPYGGYAAPGYTAATVVGRDYFDQFSLRQAFIDIFRSVFKPRALYSEMAGCETAASAWSTIVLWAILLAAAGAIGGAFSGLGAPGIVGFAFIGVGAMALILMTWAAHSLIIHLLCRSFGSAMKYNASFRCVTYAGTPYMASVMLGLVLMGPCAGAVRSELKTPGAFFSDTATPAGTTTDTKSAVADSAANADDKSGGATTSEDADSTGAKAHEQPGADSKTTTTDQDAKSDVKSGGNTTAEAADSTGSAADKQSDRDSSDVNSDTSSSSSSTGFTESDRKSLELLGGYMLLWFGMVLAQIWSVVLLGVGVANVHELSSGSAAGVAALGVAIAMVVSGIVTGIIYTICIFGAVGMAAAAAGASGGH